MKEKWRPSENEGMVVALGNPGTVVAKVAKEAFGSAPGV